MSRDRRSARADAEIMLARTRASARGATPVEVQRNVERVSGRQIYVTPSTTVRELIERADAQGWTRVEYDVAERVFRAYGSDFAHWESFSPRRYFNEPEKQS